ncbi:reverse transcriptase domain-containing protein [Tanacetum coccineum]
MNEASMQAMRNHISNLKSKLRNEMQSTMQNQNNTFKNEMRNEMQAPMSNQTNELKNMMASFFQVNTASSSGLGSLPSNTVANPRGDLKAIITQSGISYDGPSIPPLFSPLPKVVEWEPEVTKDTVLPSTKNIQPPVVQIQAPIDEPVVAPKPKPFIPYPSRANKQKLHEKDDILASKFVEIFRELHFKLSFADALLHMPKFASMFKSLLNNKEKLFDLAKTPKKPSLPELTSTRITRPKGVAEDVFVKVGKFHYPADFVVVDYDADPRVPLILGRHFLRTTRVLIDVYGEEITLRFNDEAITFKVGQTLRYSYNNSESVNRIDVIYVSCEEYVQEVLRFSRIDVINVACEEYAQEVLRFSDSSTSGNPTTSLDPILSTSSPYLTPFEEGDFILKEIKACLTNDSIPPGIDDDEFDPKGDLLLLEKLLNDDPSSPLPPKELHVKELKIVKSSVDDPPKLELKDLPSHLEYAFLEGTDKLPVIIAKNLKNDENVRLLKVLKSHKRAIAWKISDIKGIDPQFCAVLGQCKTKHFQPIHYGSKTMTDAQAPYTTMEKELLAVVYAFEKFQPYLVLSKTIVYTDHSALKYLLAKQDAKPRRASGGFSTTPSDRGTHFCNDQFAKVMLKYGVTHRLSTAYHPQTGRQVEVSNQGLKHILERTVGENHASWSDKLDDALRAFCITFKTPIGCTPYKLVYGKACHLPIELEHKAYWALKHCNFDLKTTGDHRKVQMNELNELQDQAYENSLIHKEKTKRIHDSKIKNRVFNVGDRVLFFNSRLKIFSNKLKTH